MIMSIVCLLRWSFRVKLMRFTLRQVSLSQHSVVTVSCHDSQSSSVRGQLHRLLIYTHLFSRLGCWTLCDCCRVWWPIAVWLHLCKSLCCNCSFLCLKLTACSWAFLVMFTFLLMYVSASTQCISTVHVAVLLCCHVFVRIYYWIYTSFIFYFLITLYGLCSCFFSNM